MDSNRIKAKTILKYMIEQNDQHMNELTEVIALLPEPIRKKLRLAIGSFDLANVELQMVLEELE